MVDRLDRVRMVTIVVTLIHKQSQLDNNDGTRMM